MKYFRARCGLLAILGVALVPLAARGTTFILAEPKTLLEASDAAVIGQVRAVRGVAADRTLQTHVTMAVETVIKGPAVTELTFVEPGGVIGDQRRWIHGVPTFVVGERVFVFLRYNARQELETTFMAMGKFSIVNDHGTDVAVRNLGAARVLAAADGRLAAQSPTTALALEDLVNSLRSTPAGPTHLRNDLLLQSPAITTGAEFQENFTFAGPPLARWFSADEGQPIVYRIGTEGDGALGLDASVDAAESALAAWSNTECANVHLVPGGPADRAPFTGCDGITQISFNDPNEEIPDPVECSGVLAIGGVCTDGGSVENFNGSLAYRIDEGDVLVNNGFGPCPFWTTANLAEVLTHEVGHTIGLGHSSEDPTEPDPTLRDATMYYSAHFDGRGATLMADDIAAVCALYPTGRTGAVKLRRFAIVSDVSRSEPSDRLVVDGVLTTEGGRFNPSTDTLIIDVHAAGASAFRLAVLGGRWLTNAAGNRFLYRGPIGTGRTSVILAQRGAAKLRFSIRARGLDLSTAQEDPLVISLALGSTNATETLPPLRVSAGSRVYP